MFKDAKKAQETQVVLQDWVIPYAGYSPWTESWVLDEEGNRNILKEHNKATEEWNIIYHLRN